MLTEYWSKSRRRRRSVTFEGGKSARITKIAGYERTEEFSIGPIPEDGIRFILIGEEGYAGRTLEIGECVNQPGSCVFLFITFPPVF